MSFESGFSGIIDERPGDIASKHDQHRKESEDDRHGYQYSLTKPRLIRYMARNDELDCIQHGIVCVNLSII